MISEPKTTNTYCYPNFALAPYISLLLQSRQSFVSIIFFGKNHLCKLSIG